MDVRHPSFPSNLLFACLCMRLHMCLNSNLSSPFLLPACPAGTYKPEGTPGGLGTCLPCPDVQHTSQPGSTSLSDCVCKPGSQPIGLSCQSKWSVHWFTLVGLNPEQRQFTFDSYSQLTKHVRDLACIVSMKTSTVGSFTDLKPWISCKSFPRQYLLFNKWL